MADLLGLLDLILLVYERAMVAVGNDRVVLSVVD